MDPHPPLPAWQGRQQPRWRLAIAAQISHELTLLEGSR